MELEVNKEVILGSSHSLEDIACIVTQILFEYGSKCTKIVILPDRIQLSMVDIINNEK